MQFKDERFWAECVDKNKDVYGSGVIRYAERWANEMERRMAAGEKLSKLWEDASHDADTEGVTGFMYGAAVSILSRVWIHGDELRKLHNKEYGGSGDEKGTINPAIITVDAKDEKDLVDKIKKAAIKSGFQVL